MNFNRFYLPICIVISFLFCSNLKAQTIKITNAKIETSIVNERKNLREMRGEIYVEFEIENPTTDTLYLFKRAVEPFIEKRPFQLSQNIDRKKFDENCKSIFIYFRPPSMYHFNPFNNERDVLKIAPKNKFVSFLSYDAAEGLCAENVEKIEVQLTYELLKSDFSPEEYLNSIYVYENSLPVLKNQKKLFEKSNMDDELINKLKALEQEIEEMEYKLAQAKKRLSEHDVISKTPFYSRKIVSNSVNLIELTN